MSQKMFHKTNSTSECCMNDCLSLDTINNSIDETERFV